MPSSPPAELPHPPTRSECERIAGIDAYKDLTRTQEHRFIITTSIPAPSAHSDLGEAGCGPCEIPASRELRLCNRDVAGSPSFSCLSRAADPKSSALRNVDNLFTTGTIRSHPISYLPSSKCEFAAHDSDEPEKSSTIWRVSQDRRGTRLFL